MISLIVMEPENDENLGSIARVMKNFDLTSLLLVNPKCDHLSGKAMMMSTHAKSILKKAKIVDKTSLDSFDYLIGTTAKLGTAANVPRSPLSPEQLTSKIKRLKKSRKIGLLIGRESSGLSNQEIQQCDFTVTIPTSKKYSTMNISHAVAILLYELQKNNIESVSSHITYADNKDKDVLLSYIQEKLDLIDFQTNYKKQTQEKVWKRVIGKAVLTKKESFTLMSFFKKVR